MKRLFILAFAAIFSVASATSLLSAAPAVQRVEPLSWWTDMHCPLTLMFYGTDLADAQVSVSQMTAKGKWDTTTKGIVVKGQHNAESANYLFVDIEVNEAGNYRFLLQKNGQRAVYDYVINTRRAGSRDRQSFTSADVIYLIMSDRFVDGDPKNNSTRDTKEKADKNNVHGRWGGDIQGIINSFDHIVSLGATAIWPTPMLEDNEAAWSYHGYACSDYYHMDPRFGTNELYCSMVQQAHKKGLKVLMDMVPNHCGSEHWWMKDRPFKDWVHPSDPYVNSNHTMGLALDPNASKADLSIMEEGWFSRGMPDMNLDNPFLLKYFQQWAVWWIEYSGLDGFRVDTWFYNEKEPMAAWAKAVTDEYPYFNIVGENWHASPDYVAYWQGGNPNSDGFDSHLPSIMDFPLQGAISSTLTAPIPGSENRQMPGGPGRGRRGGPDISAIYNALSHDFIYHDLSHMLIFLSNHDIARIGDTFGHDPRRMKMAFTLLATLRGIPQLFYGDEMMFVTGNPNRDDGRLRMDFPGGWEGDALNLFTEKGRSSAAQDSSWAHAAHLHDFARTLFRWRKGKEVIHSGKTLHFIPQDNTYGYFRYNDKDVVFVFLNNSAEERNVSWTRFREITDGLGAGRNVLTGESVTITDDTRVPAYGTLVVEFSR